MTAIAYYRVSTADQSVAAQRAALADGAPEFAKEFTDEGVSGAIPAAQRPAFSELLKYVRDGDHLYVYAVDRLGRDAIDVQATVRSLLSKGVTVHVHGLGAIARGVGELILAVLSQVADMERQRIIERTANGRTLARASLEATGRTHRGKASLGRPVKADAGAVVAWRKANGASVSVTAAHFGLSAATVKRYGQAQRN